MASLKLVCAIVLCMVVVAPMVSEAAINCGTVNTKMLPCLGYLRNGGAVTVACCNGVRAVNDAAKNSATDRQATCECLKSAGSNFGVKEQYAAALPGKCGVNLPFKITNSINCKSV